MIRNKLNNLPVEIIQHVVHTCKLNVCHAVLYHRVCTHTLRGSSSLPHPVLSLSHFTPNHKCLGLVHGRLYSHLAHQNNTANLVRDQHNCIYHWVECRQVLAVP